MRDLSAAILLACTAGITFYVADLIVPINRPSINMRWGVMLIAVHIALVGSIYGAFAVGLETGVAWRPYGKALNGLAALWAGIWLNRAMMRR